MSIQLLNPLRYVQSRVLSPPNKYAFRGCYLAYLYQATRVRAYVPFIADFWPEG